MRYEVYTDGACATPVESNKGPASGGFFIRSTSEYIAHGFKKFDGVMTINLTEVLAVGLALTYVLENIELQSRDEVRIYVDNDFVRERLKEYRNPEFFFGDKWKALTVYKQLQEVSSKCHIRFPSINAHKPDSNWIDGNKVADRFAKYALRFMSQGDE